MQEIMAWLVSLFLVEPLQAGIDQALRAGEAPQLIAGQLTACVTEAAPLIIERAVGDPGWAASNAVRVWPGTASLESVLVEAAPGCAAAVEAARPFLTEVTS